MYLKALEIYGFKSFPERTRLVFEKEITAIVGPNGSGKSNISDALLWVMGEQSTKNLRGSKMQDVIFGGTSERPAMGYAEVKLFLNNSDKLFDADSDELIISRKYYRSGESEYKINNKPARLKDLSAILMNTGLGKFGYSIIGQGRIAEIINGKSSARRDILEEAAGISKFRIRKEEAERRLEKTEFNLLRINDKIDELSLRVEPLRIQSEQAKKFLKFRDELREEEVSLWLYQIDKLRSESKEFLSDYENSKKSLETEEVLLNSAFQRSEFLSERMSEQDIETEKMRQVLSELIAKKSETESQIAVIKTQITNIEDSIKNTELEQDKGNEREKELEAMLSEQETQKSVAKERMNELTEELKSAENVINGHKLKLQNRESVFNELSSALTKKLIELGDVDSRINLLSEMKRDYEGFSYAVKFLMKQKNRGVLKGIEGTVAELISVDSELSLAVEIALGSATGNIVCERQKDAKSAIELLKREKAGRATFLPIDKISSRKENRALAKQEGLLGLASDLIQYDEKYRDIVENLLGRTYITETLQDAIDISNKSGDRYRFVSLDGQLVNAGGSMTGGSVSKSVGILSRQAELDELSAKRGTLAKERDGIQRKLNEADSELKKIRFSMESGVEQLQELRKEDEALLSRLRVLEGSIRQLRTLWESLSRDSEVKNKAIAQLKSNKVAYEKDVLGREKELLAVNERIQKQKDKISESQGSRLKIEAEKRKADKLIQEKNSDILNMQRAVARLEQKKSSIEFEENNLISKLWDSYELSFNEAQRISKGIASISGSNKLISGIKSEISKLGNPNIGAIEEFEIVNERYNYLTEQRDDIYKAKRDINALIEEIVTEMTEIFSREFGLIKERFSEIFIELFGGGSASLVLLDEDEILDSDIEIMVQPPGKRISNISLLSGGEMAFVAIALYFAIISVRPTPFCVMDEIDAALDEANVIRFASYLRQLSDKTQFILITHKRNTMEQADYLYGVTMQRNGISNIISLDIEEAERELLKEKK